MRCIELLSTNNQDHQTETNRKGRNHNRCFIWIMLTSRFDLVIFVIILVHMDHILTLHVPKGAKDSDIP